MSKKNAENLNAETIDETLNTEPGTNEAGADTGKVDLEATIRAAFDASREAGKEEEDDIKLDMIGAGATFKNVTRLYNVFAVDAGLVVGKEEKDQILLSVLTGADLSTEEGFNSKVTELMAALAGATDKSAAALIRAYAKKNGLEVFKKAKGAGGEAKAGFAGKFYEWLVANPTSTVAEATAFINGTDGHEETTENVKRHQSHYLAIHRLVNRVAGVQVA